MKIEKFEEIIAWQKARILTKQIYNKLNSCKDFSFRDQIKRASISVMNNIAEGFERKSNQEFIYFLYVAKGSSGEVRSMIFLAHDLNYLNKKDSLDLYLKTIEISRLLSGLIKSLR